MLLGAGLLGCCWFVAGVLRVAAGVLLGVLQGCNWGVVASVLLGCSWDQCGWCVSGYKWDTAGKSAVRVLL